MKRLYWIIFIFAVIFGYMIIAIQAVAETDSLDSLDFIVNIKNTPLKFASIILDTGVVFTIDGKFPSEAIDRMNYMIIVPPIIVNKDQQKEIAIKNAKTNTENLQIEKINRIKVSGLSGYEVIGYESDNNNQKKLRYNTVLFEIDKYYEFVGYTNNKLTERLSIFKRLTRSFQKKY